MQATKTRVFRFLASYGLSVVLLLFLSLLTLLGTLEQAHQGLYAVQKKYFESLFVVHWVFDAVPVPLPGVFLLMVLLTVNLVCGAVVRTPKAWGHAGILLTHAGILVLLGGSFVTFQFSQRGNLTLYEGEQKDVFVSHDTWEIAIAPESTGEAVTEHIIPQADFAATGHGKKVTFNAEGLPFGLTLDGYTPNAHPEQGKDKGEFVISPLPPAKEAEENLPGIHATVTDKASSATHRGVLWGGANAPWSAEIGGSRWRFDLRRQTTPLSFTVRLDKFTRELYPGSGVAKAFKSDVTVLDGGAEQKSQISMNAPLRHKGYTFYQSSWGPQNARSGARLYSSLAVVRNPADQFPLYACCVICLGLLVHFCQKLAGYLIKESKRRA